MRRRAGQLARLVALAMVVVWSLFPIYWALKTSLSTNVAAQSTPVQWWPAHLNFTAYQALFGAGPESQDAAGGIARSLVNITVEATGATILTLVVSVLGAYAFARLHFRLKGVLFYAVIATLMLPVYATLIPLYRIMADLRLVDTYTGIILVYTSGFIPLAMWIMYNVFMALPAPSKRRPSSTVPPRCKLSGRSCCPRHGPGSPPPPSSLFCSAGASSFSHWSSAAAAPLNP